MNPSAAPNRVARTSHKSTSSTSESNRPKRQRSPVSFSSIVKPPKKTNTTRPKPVFRQTATTTQTSSLDALIGALSPYSSPQKNNPRLFQNVQTLIDVSRELQTPPNTPVKLTRTTQVVITEEFEAHGALNVLAQRVLEETKKRERVVTNETDEAENASPTAKRAKLTENTSSKRLVVRLQTNNAAYWIPGMKDISEVSLLSLEPSKAELLANFIRSNKAPENAENFIDLLILATSLGFIKIADFLWEKLPAKFDRESIISLVTHIKNYEKADFKEFAKFHDLATKQGLHSIAKSILIPVSQIVSNKKFCHFLCFTVYERPDLLSYIVGTFPINWSELVSCIKEDKPNSYKVIVGNIVNALYALNFRTQAIFLNSFVTSAMDVVETPRIAPNTLPVTSHVVMHPPKFISNPLNYWIHERSIEEINAALISNLINQLHLLSIFRQNPSWV